MMSDPKTDQWVYDHPLTPERWADLEKLFGPRGAYGGCWCMFWRLKRTEFSEGKGEGNRKALKTLVDDGQIPGILAYAGGEPVGWCSVGPREAFGSLERSPKLKRIDNELVWSIMCFYVAKPYRKEGMTVFLLRAAVDYVRSRGGSIVEGYPVWPKDPTDDVNVYMGTGRAFIKAGFVEVARPSEGRSIMRCYLS